MSELKSRREVLIGTAVAATAVILPSIAKGDPNSTNPSLVQGGTNPIIIGPTTPVASGPGRTVSATVYPGTDDTESDVYNVRIVSASAIKKVTGLQIEVTHTGINGIKGGEQYKYFSFPKKDGVLQPVSMSFELDNCTGTKVLTICVYGPQDFPRSSLCTFELLKT